MGCSFSNWHVIVGLFSAYKFEYSSRILRCTFETGLLSFLFLLNMIRYPNKHYSVLYFKNKTFFKTLFEGYKVLVFFFIQSVYVYFHFLLPEPKRSWVQKPLTHYSIYYFFIPHCLCTRNLLEFLKLLTLTKVICSTELFVNTIL